VAFRELENYGLILPAPPASVPVTLDKVAARFGTRLHVAFEIDSLSVRKDLPRDGKHFSVMPMLAVKDESGEWPATLLRDREVTQQHLAETPAR